MSLVFRNWLECALWFFPLFFILLWLHWPCWFYVYVFITSENLSAIIFVTFSSPLCPLLWSPFHLCWAGCYCSRSHWGCLCSILDMLCYNVSYSLLFLFVGSDLLLTTSSGFFFFFILDHIFFIPFIYFFSFPHSSVLSVYVFL